MTSKVKFINLRINKIVPNSGKHLGLMKALELSSDDGKIHTRVDSGFSDAQKELLNNPRVLGKIVEISYNNIILEESGCYSLDSPKFVRFLIGKENTTQFEEI